ncbi:MAG: hypothetical protein PHC51_02665 [bacterium]|nr:hypothetical protein [bacterium]
MAYRLYHLRNRQNNHLRSVVRPVFLLFAAICLFACDKVEPHTRELKQQVRSLGDAVGEIIEKPEVPLDELAKLQRFEYKLLRIPQTGDDKEVEQQLASMGHERWDCSPMPVATEVLKTPDTSYLFLCKRRPDTPLRFIPRYFP